MTISNFKSIFIPFLIGTFLSLSPNLTAQSKLKQKSNLDSTELNKFLTVQHDYIKIPIIKMASGHLHIDVVLNDVNGEFILDTGSGATVVDIKRKTKFNLKTEETKNSGAGAGGTQTLQKAVNNSFKLGGLTKNKFEIYVMNLDHVNKALTSMGIKEVDGVIGADILTDNKAIIDYSNLA